jgi:hypothetical protein
VWIRRFGADNCSYDKCIDDSDESCLQKSLYDWETRSFSLTYNDKSTENESCFINNINTLEQNYEYFEMIMRLVYREHQITPMRIVKNMTQEYQEIHAEATYKCSVDDKTGTLVPYEFILMYTGTNAEIDQEVQSSMEILSKALKWYPDSWSALVTEYDFEANLHRVKLYMNITCSQAENCASDFSELPDTEKFACIGDKCSQLPPCTPPNTRSSCNSNQYRFLAGRTCSARPDEKSLCGTILSYVLGTKSTENLNVKQKEVLPRIIDVECGTSEGNVVYVLVDVLDGSNDELETLQGLIGISTQEANVAKCCVGGEVSTSDSAICVQCADGGGTRRLLNFKSEGGADLSTIRVRITDKSMSTSGDRAGYLSVGAIVAIVCACLTFGFFWYWCFCKKRYNNETQMSFMVKGHPPAYVKYLYLV